MSKTYQNVQQPYFYHGTNTFQFTERQHEGFYFQEETSSLQVYYKVSSALFAGIHSCKRRKWKDAKPLLIAIPKEKYWENIKINFLCTGKLAPAHYEIHGKIALDDLVNIDSLHKLKDICYSTTKREREKFEKYFL